MPQTDDLFILKRPCVTSTGVWVGGIAVYLAMWIAIHHGQHEPAWPFWPALLVFVLLFVPLGVYAAIRRRGKIARASADEVVFEWFVFGALRPSLPRTRHGDGIAARSAGT